MLDTLLFVVWLVGVILIYIYGLSQVLLCVVDYCAQPPPQTLLILAPFIDVYYGIRDLLLLLGYVAAAVGRERERE